MLSPILSVTQPEQEHITNNDSTSEHVQTLGPNPLCLVELSLRSDKETAISNILAQAKTDFETIGGPRQWLQDQCVGDSKEVFLKFLKAEVVPGAYETRVKLPYTQDEDPNLWHSCNPKTYVHNHLNNV